MELIARRVHDVVKSVHDTATGQHVIQSDKRGYNAPDNQQSHLNHIRPSHCRQSPVNGICRGNKGQPDNGRNEQLPVTRTNNRINRFCPQEKH